MQKYLCRASNNVCTKANPTNNAKSLHRPCTNTQAKHTVKHYATNKLQKISLPLIPPKVSPSYPNFQNFFDSKYALCYSLVFSKYPVSSNTSYSCAGCLSHRRNLVTSTLSSSPSNYEYDPVTDSFVKKKHFNDKQTFTSSLDDKKDFEDDSFDKKQSPTLSTSHNDSQNFRQRSLSHEDYQRSESNRLDSPHLSQEEENSRKFPEAASNLLAELFRRWLRFLLMATGGYTIYLGVSEIWRPREPAPDLDEDQLPTSVVERVRELASYDWDTKTVNRQDALMKVVSKLGKDSEVIDKLGQPVQVVGFLVSNKQTGIDFERMVRSAKSSHIDEALEDEMKRITCPTNKSQETDPKSGPPHKDPPLKDPHNPHGGGNPHNTQTEEAPMAMQTQPHKYEWSPSVIIEGSKGQAQLDLQFFRPNRERSWILLAVRLEPLQPTGQLLCDIKGQLPNGLNNYTRFTRK